MSDKPAGGLPPIRTFITGHNSSGKAIVHSEEPVKWTHSEPANTSMALSYTTTSFPPVLNNDEDLAKHKEIISSGDLGLVSSGGTVCRFVDFGPDNKVFIHRTESLDYGVVVEGSIEMILECGEVRTLQRGDVAIQRATMHGWRNPSPTEWCRMMFVLQPCEPVKVGDKVLKEDISALAEALSES